MESPDLNRPRPTDEQLDAWLNANAATAPLPDNGFSLRVLQALPARVDPVVLAGARREEQAEARRRAAFCAAGAVAGLIVYLVDRGGGVNLADSWRSLDAVSFDLRQVLSTLATVGIALASLALAYWKQLKALQQDHA